MGRLIHLGRRVALVVAATALAVLASTVAPPPVAGFDGFGDQEAEATFGESLTFSVEFVGDPPEELDLLLDFADDEVTFVEPVAPGREGAEFVWDTSEDFIFPNTPVSYRWRATDGSDVVISDQDTILYDDDRRHLDWDVLDTGQARVHWHGGQRDRAEDFGGLMSASVERAEGLFGAEIGDAVDIFVYSRTEDFFTALPPGSREWTGGVALWEIRSVFVRLDAASDAQTPDYMFHEVAHMVFADATDNPYHEPALWLNEGLATWLERESADNQASMVEAAAGDGRLLAFEAITDSFPVESDAALLAYAQSASLVDYVIDRYGRDAIARIVDAYAEGASDTEAVEAGTGVPLDAIIEDWFAQYGQQEPEPLSPAPLLPAEGGLPGESSPGPDRPGVSSVEPGGSPGAGGGEGSESARPGSLGDRSWAWVLPLAGLVLLASLALGALALRRATAGAPDDNG